MASNVSQNQLTEFLRRLAALEHANNVLQIENEALRANQASPPAASQPVSELSVHRRAVLPDPERFDESNPKLYDPFQRDLRAKFRADGWQYPSAQGKADYIMSRLSGVIKLRAEAWMTVLEKAG